MNEKTADTDMLDNMDLDDLLDSSIDDFEDLPDFEPYPVGTHRVYGTLSLKEVNDKVNVEFSMKAIETLELKDKVKDQPLAEGAPASVLFNFGSEWGRGAFKKVFAGTAEKLGATSNRQLIENFQEVDCVVVTKLRTSKDDKDKKYTNVVELVITE